MLESLRLDGRIAIVTGGSRGLGREMALALADAGAEVAIAARGRERLDETAAFIAEHTGRKPLVVPTNIQSREACDALIAATVEHFDGADIMVNNAGIGDGRGGGPIWDLEDEDFIDGMEANLYGTLYCSRAFVRHLREAQKPGAILNVSSGMGMRGSPNSLTYAAAKAGVISLTQSLAMQLAKENIRVNCIVPGFVAQMPPQSDEERERDKARGRFIPARRGGEAWELGPLAVLLCSDAAAYITGESIPIDGGGLAGGIAPTGFTPVLGGIRG